MRVIYPMVLAILLGVAAQPVTAQSGGATVSKDGICGGFVPTASGGIGAFIFTTDSVAISKGNGSSSVSCHFDIPGPLIPTNTTRARNFICNTYLGSSTDSRMHASSGGNATLTCRVRTGG